MTRSAKIIIGVIIGIVLISTGGIVWYKYKGPGKASSLEEEQQLHDRLKTYSYLFWKVGIAA